MSLTAGGVVVALGFAALSGVLALLVAGVRPRPRINVLVTLLFAANAGVALTQALVETGIRGGPVAALLDQLRFIAGVPTWLAMFIIPLVFPRDLLGSRGRHAIYGGVGLVALASVVAALLVPESFLPHPNPLRTLLVGIPFALGGLLGVFVFLDAYLGSPSPVRRTQAQFFLAAYAMKLATFTAPAGEVPRFATGGAGLLDGAYQALMPWAMLAALLAMPLAIGSARLLRRPAGARGFEGGDAFLLGFLGLGLGIAHLAPDQDLEYLFARPILFAYGILQFQLLNVDLRERRGLVGAALLAAVGSLFVYLTQALGAQGLDPAVAMGLALVASLGVAGALAWPMLRVVLTPPGPVAPEPRARDLYRAALEQSLATSGGDPGSSSERMLQALRLRVGLSEREHALLEAEVRAAVGRVPATLAPGSLFLGKYRVESALGEGGFGRAFLAYDQKVERRVVLKAARVTSPEEAKRLLREARVLAKLRHPSIVVVYDVEEVGGEVVLVLEHVEGGSLAERLERGALPLAEALAMTDDVLAALEASHAQGIIHRDIKPGNILLTRDGRAKLADFGVARAPASTGTVSGLSSDGNPGSVRYMSPEQVRGRELDARSDLYAAAAVLYEALAGHPYLDFRGRSEFEARLAVLEEEPALPLERAPAEVNRVLRAALAKDPPRRPASATAMRLALQAARPSAPAAYGPGPRKAGARVAPSEAPLK